MVRPIPSGDFQCNRLKRSAVRPDHDVEQAGFDHFAHVEIPQRKGLRTNGQAHGAAFARLQRDTFEALELAHRARRPPRPLVDIELRHLIAREAVQVHDAPYNTLHLADAARDILKGQSPVRLRSLADKVSGSARSGRQRAARATAKDDGVPLSLSERECLEALKAWRAGVAREHNLPAFVIFHDATLRSIAARKPESLADLDGIAGIGQKKREAYGADVVRVVSAFV